MPKYSYEVLCNEYMQDIERENALKKLSGMRFNDIKKLTGINDDYYLRKILFRKTKMSGYIYFKIIPDKLYGNNHRYCARCGKILCSLNRIYCSYCDDRHLSNHIVNYSAPDDSIVRSGQMPAIGKSRSIKD